MDEKTPHSEAEALVEEGAMSVSQVSRFWGVGRTYVYDRVAAGEVDVIREGNRILIPRRSAIAYLAQRLRRASTSDPGEPAPAGA